jgi:hypothetical protein
MSGDWSDGDRSRAQALGCKIFSKPFDLDELSTWVDESSRLGERVLAGHFFNNSRQQNPDRGLRVLTSR